MTSTVKGDKKLAETLHLGEVDAPELLHVLLDFFKHAAWISRSVQRFGPGPDGSTLELSFDSHGAITPISSTLSTSASQALSVRISTSLITEQHEAIAQTICFSRNRVVKGVYRSELAHGGDMLLADLEYWNFLGTARHQWQESLQWNTSQIASAALVNWILNR